MKIFLLPKIATQSPRNALFTTIVSRDDIDRALMQQCVNHEKACGTVSSCDIDNRQRRVFLHYLHRNALVLSRC
jgi:hypothetical protein